MNDFTEKEMRDAQKDRITVKSEEVKFIDGKDLAKLGIKLYGQKKED